MRIQRLRGWKNLSLQLIREKSMSAFLYFCSFNPVLVYPHRWVRPSLGKPMLSFQRHSTSLRKFFLFLFFNFKLYWFNKRHLQSICCNMLYYCEKYTDAQTFLGSCHVMTHSYTPSAGVLQLLNNTTAAVRLTYT